jgi:hypothetical protein
VKLVERRENHRSGVSSYRARASSASAAVVADVVDSLPEADSMVSIPDPSVRCRDGGDVIVVVGRRERKQ